MAIREFEMGFAPVIHKNPGTFEQKRRHEITQSIKKGKGFCALRKKRKR